MSVSIADKARCVRAGFVVDSGGVDKWALIYNPRSTATAAGIAQCLDVFDEKEKAWEAACEALKSFPPHLKGE